MSIRNVFFVLYLLAPAGLAQDSDPTSPSIALRKALAAIEPKSVPSVAAAVVQPTIPVIALKARIGTSDSRAALLQVGQNLIVVREGDSFTVTATNTGKTLQLTVPQIGADLVRIVTGTAIPDILLR